jgi:hypothetical protein
MHERTRYEGRFRRTTKASYLVAAAFAAGVSSSALAAINDTATFTFNTQAVANAVPENPVATLSLLETGTGVQFTLTPIQNGGYNSNTFIDQLWYAYNGPTLDATTFVATGGNPINSFAFDSTVNGHTEAGYSPLRINVDFPNANTPDRFHLGEISVWTIPGTHIDNFTTAFVTDGPQKPSPEFGVLSIDGLSGGSSNWVAAAAVPEPGTWAMLTAGLIGLCAMVRRRISL